MTAVLVGERRGKGANGAPSEEYLPPQGVRSLSKADDGEEGEYTPSEEDKRHIKSALLGYAEALVAGMAVIDMSALWDLVATGAQLGGGDLSQADIQGIVDKVAAFQAEHAGGFQGDMGDAVDELLAETGWADQADFMAGVQDFMDWAENRAESYAVGGGQPAWRAGVLAGAKEAGYAGGIWICTFAQGSCKDCLALHGQWMTWADFEDTFGNTECNGGCLCGLTPADNPDDLGSDDLEEVDSSVEAF